MGVTSGRNNRSKLQLVFIDPVPKFSPPVLLSSYFFEESSGALLI